MCTSPIEIHRRDVVSGRVYKYVVPCGKCHDCLNTAQNDNAVLSYFEAIKRGKLVFATLTYNNQSFPIRERCGIMHDDGTIIWQSSNFVAESRLPKMRDFYVDVCKEDFSKVLRTDVLTDSCGKKLVYEFAPSLCRKHFQDMLKRARVAYVRKFGNDSLPDFSYMLVGEYGELNHRPHYHVCFYGLEERVVRILLDDWPKLYGYIDVKPVQRFNGDLSHDGFFAVSRYLGKYLTKGYSDSYNVICGISEKSRVCRSIGFGIPDRRELQSLLSFTLWKIMLDIHLVNA